MTFWFFLEEGYYCNCSAVGMAIVIDGVNKEEGGCSQSRSRNVEEEWQAALVVSRSSNSWIGAAVQHGQKRFVSWAAGTFVSVVFWQPLGVLCTKLVMGLWLLRRPKQMTNDVLLSKLLGLK